jgi:hypothetical protein
LILYILTKEYKIILDLLTFGLTASISPIFAPSSFYILVLLAVLVLVRLIIIAYFLFVTGVSWAFSYNLDFIKFLALLATLLGDET